MTERRRRRLFRSVEACRDEVIAEGRFATSEPVEPGSFFTRPVDEPPLRSFDEGVATALRQHLASQGLDGLAATVDDLVSYGRRLGTSTDETVSDTVYAMH